MNEVANSPESSKKKVFYSPCYLIHLHCCPRFHSKISSRSMTIPSYNQDCRRRPFLHPNCKHAEVEGLGRKIGSQPACALIETEATLLNNVFSQANRTLEEKEIMQRARKGQEWDALATEQVGLEKYSEVGIRGSGRSHNKYPIEKMRTRKSLLIKEEPPGADKIKNKA